MAAKPSELRLGKPDDYDGSYEKAIPWLHSVQFYLITNADLYNSDAKKVAFALSFMKNGSAATWANTFRTKVLAASPPSFGTFEDFVKIFKKTFQHEDLVAKALHWMQSTRTKLSDINTYIAEFKNYAALSEVSDDVVLISFFARGIPDSLRQRIFSMDTPPTTIEEWYSKAVHFVVQWERADAYKTGRVYSTFRPTASSTASAKDPDAMDVDVVKIGKLTPEERRRCMSQKLCFRCRQPGHMSNACPTFPTPGKKKTSVKKVAEEAQLPKLEPVPDDDDEEDPPEETIKRVTFSGWGKGF